MSVKVMAESYDDRGDPCPPKNWRTEILIDGQRWACVDEEFQTEAQAERRAKSVACKLRAYGQPKRKKASQ